MARTLTAGERETLAHVVVDPDAWWAHCQATFPAEGGGLTAEVALARKLERWTPDFMAAKARDKASYKTRAAREEI